MSHHNLNTNTTRKKFKFFERELSDNLHITKPVSNHLHDLTKGLDTCNGDFEIILF